MTHPPGGTPCAQDGGLGRSGPFGGRPGPHEGLCARMELGLQWLKARGFLAGGPGSCLVFRSCVPAQSPRQVQLPREPGGGSGLSPPHHGCSSTPSHRALAVRGWGPGIFMGRPFPCRSVLRPGSSSVTSQSRHWEPSATREKRRNTEGTLAGSMEPRMSHSQIKPEPHSEASGRLPLTPTPTVTKATDARIARSRAPGLSLFLPSWMVGLTRKVC